MKIISDIADGLVGVGLITQNEDMPGMLTMDKGYNDMSKFLNRILGMPVNLQNLLFKYFTDTLNSIIDSVSSFLEIFIFTIFFSFTSFFFNKDYFEFSPSAGCVLFIHIHQLCNCLFTNLFAGDECHFNLVLY